MSVAVVINIKTQIQSHVSRKAMISGKIQAKAHMIHITVFGKLVCLSYNAHLFRVHNYSASQTGANAQT